MEKIMFNQNLRIKAFTLENAFEKFMDWQKAKNLAADTIIYYNNCFKSFRGILYYFYPLYCFYRRKLFGLFQIFKINLYKWRNHSY